MVDLEIDGEQHFTLKALERDMVRTEYLESLGWKTIRVRWRDYSKLKIEDREVFISNLLEQLKG